MKTCDACGKFFETLDRCHIFTRGSRNIDDEWNVVYMDRGCHQLQHSLAWKRFSERYPSILEILQERGFYFDQFNKLRKDIL